MIALVEERRARVGIGPLCDALGLARATFYRRRGGPPPTPTAPRERRPPLCVRMSETVPTPDITDEGETG